ncbi:MAG: glycoside hydrolase family 3 N-terminal domain-containing protein [Myxococcota bacterium]|nr:glycoside hydrolase family 3 N-terminal domain-containing protein [Myxococcota bacterium]
MSDFSDASARVSQGANPRDEATLLVQKMTREEKLGCLDGDLPFWPGLIEMMSGGYNTRTWPAAHVDRLGIPGLDFIDGPRGCVVGPATTFPVSMARGAAFDPELEERIGRAIGAELRATGATFTGAVCMNLLRHPAWGRAQETYGEDPHHVGEMAAALTRGLQQHVMACMKHFAMNSMENARFQVNVVADERALHEVYLPHFRRVADEGVASVMSAYNSVNGEWCGQNKELLTTILREEWGWDGFVITDFINGLRDPALSVEAGCNIEMPFSQQRAQALAPALDEGRLEIADVDDRVIETIATFLRFRKVYTESPAENVISCEAHRQLAREAAADSAVLLRNEGLLPLKAQNLSKIAVLGELAAAVNLGDEGSSNVLFTPNPITPLEGLKERFSEATIVHSAEDASVAKGADVAIVVVGFTRHDEGEYIGAGMNDALQKLMPPADHPTLGFSDPSRGEQLGEIFKSSAGVAGGQTESGGDRKGLRLPAHHEELIAAAQQVNDHVIVVVICGSAVVCPWLDSTAATLILFYAGSEGGRALGDLLCGDAEPGGRLPFAIPAHEDSLVAFEREATEAHYDLLHGQWKLDAENIQAHRPFGYGLGYTTFELGNAEIENQVVSVNLTNSGSRSGSTVVQVYGSVPESEYLRPPKRLVAFSKVRLKAGEEKTVRLPVKTSLLDLRIGGKWKTEEKPVRLAVGFDADSARPI